MTYLLATFISLFGGRGQAQRHLSPPTAKAGTHWVGSWSAAPTTPLGEPGWIEYHDQSLRQIVLLTQRGDALRVTFSNEAGIKPVLIEDAHVAVHQHGPSIVSGTDHELHFNGQRQAWIQPGTTVTSDVVPMQTEPLQQLAISIYLPLDTINPTGHPISNATAYITHGDKTSANYLAMRQTVQQWTLIDKVDVQTLQPEARIAVAFGDSITDGFHASLDQHEDYPARLSIRLHESSLSQVSVLNAGLGGNRLVSNAPPQSLWSGASGLSRLDQDALLRPGIRYLLLEEGRNDIGTSTAQEIIAGYREVIRRAHEDGVLVYGCTILPTAFRVPSGRLDRLWRPIWEALYGDRADYEERDTLNFWIRNSQEFDPVIDFAAALEDPTAPSRLLPIYDSGDGVHPSDQGYQKMADTVPLYLFERQYERPGPRFTRVATIPVGMRFRRTSSHNGVPHEPWPYDGLKCLIHRERRLMGSANALSIR